MKQYNNPNNTPTYVYALGGLEEIGKNTYVIEHDDELYIFDAGIKFASSEMLGVNGLVVNYDYLIENQHKIKGLVITHGHEDHIGGIIHLIRKVEIPKIYAALLPTKLIERKIKEHKDVEMPTFEVFDDDTVIKSKHFEIDFCRVCHSIPDSFLIAIKTPNGDVVSTGDFRFDFATNGDQTNLKKLMDISRRDIDVLLCESTSSEVPGFSESERYIINNLRTIIINSLGRVLISTFASNLGRVEEIIDLSVKLKRKVVILGKSMEANVKTSIKIGYLKVNERDIISAKEINNYNDEEIIVILTGSQGETNAALNVMASGKHAKVTLKPSDTIVLSSNPIPGNYANVESLVNNLYKHGVKVIENSPDMKIHASGHATRSEQQLMINAVDPTYIFPIHGEYKMLRALEKNALDLGYDKDHIIITENGNKLQLLNGVLSKTDIYVPVAPTYIDGKLNNSTSVSIIEDRHRLANNGIMQVIIYLNEQKNSLKSNPLITTRGSLLTKNSTGFLTKLSYTVASIAKEYLEKNEAFDEIDFKAHISANVEKIVIKWKRKNPFVLTSIFVEGDCFTPANNQTAGSEADYFENLLNK